MSFAPREAGIESRAHGKDGRDEEMVGKGREKRTRDVWNLIAAARKVSAAVGSSVQMAQAGVKRLLLDRTLQGPDVCSTPNDGLNDLHNTSIASCAMPHCALAGSGPRTVVGMCLIIFVS